MINETKYLKKIINLTDSNSLRKFFFNFPYEVEEFCSEYEKLDSQKPWIYFVSPNMSPIMKDDECVDLNVGLKSSSDRIFCKN